MNINKRNRVELKSVFVKNAIPTEVGFADLIDAMVNQKEDGLVKLPGNPLCIEASGDEVSQKKAINFYKNFSDENPDWVLSLNSRNDPADADAPHAGLSISDATGNSRLFIDKSTGNVGIGTVTPMQTLDINGGASITGALTVGSLNITSSITQENWRSVSFENGWINFGENYTRAGYFKDSLGIVYLRGLVKTNTSNYKRTTIFTLPSGYRPESTLILSTVTHPNTLCEIRIYPTGRIQLYSGNSIWVSLDGVSFRPA